MKIKHRFLIFLALQILLYIVADKILPRGANNEIIWSQWYRPIFGFVPILTAAFCDKIPLLFQKNNDATEMQDDFHEEEEPKYNSLLNDKTVVPGRSDIVDLYYTDAGKEHVNLLCRKVQESAITVNSTDKPDKFFDALNYLIDCLLDLQQYEQYGIFQDRTPSEYLQSILEGLERLVDSFVDRALEQEKTKRSSIADPKKSYDYHEKFMIALISAFDYSNSFWSGDKASPHYIGPLYAKANYDRVQKIYDQLDEEYDKAFPLNIAVAAPPKEPEPEKLSYADKERIMVERIQQGDMEQFTNIPYELTGTIHKFTGEHTHAFAYMNLNRRNVAIAKEHITLLNRIIDRHRADIPLLEKKYFIDTNKVVFAEVSKACGYSKLICWPYTFTGKVSKFPLELLYMTDLRMKSYSANGTIRYGVDGEIKSAEANIWYKPKESEPGSGWLFSFWIINGDLELGRAKSTLSPDKHGMPADVYKDYSVILEEKQREADYEIYYWIEKNLPDLCPKSPSAFRTMKKKNTKNYQKLVSEAAKLGKEL